MPAAGEDSAAFGGCGDGGGRLRCIGNVNPSGRGMSGKVYDACGIAPTITAGNGSGVKVFTGPGMHLGERRIRRLTPRECFRLQGFPDELFEKAAAVSSNAQLYKQAGNAVTVNVAYAVASLLRGQPGGACPGEVDVSGSG